jgi:hypothetical protein
MSGQKFLLFVFLVLGLFIRSVSFSHAQDSVRQSVLKNIEEAEDRRLLTLVEENDILASGDDGNYTHGTRLIYREMGKKPPIITKLVHLIPSLELNETTSSSYSLGHNIYTPQDITNPNPQPNDRPWAAFLYTSIGLTTASDDYVDSVEMTVGVLGPMASGESIQKQVHKFIDTRNPQGWEHQLHNELGFFFTWNRRWPQTLLYKTGDIAWSLEPNIAFALGNVYTYAGSGVVLKISPWESRWQELPIQVSPSIPSGGLFYHSQGWDWFAFTGLQGRLVGRNIFLDGNTFKESPSVDKKPLVFDTSIGIAFTYEKWRLSYIIVNRSKEFKGQEKKSRFGSISLNYRF